MIPLSYNVRSLVERRATTAAAVLGIALVVFVLSASLMLVAGVEKTLGGSGEPDRAIVLRKGSDNELSSGIEIGSVPIIAAAPGVRSGEGGGLVVGEIVVVAAMEKLGGAGMSNVLIRGVAESVFRFRPEVRFTRGRAPRPGTDEAAIGARIAGRFRGLEMDRTFELRKNRSATVVGIFEAGGSSFESEVWVDVETIRQAFRREGMVSSARVRLESPAAFEAFEEAVEQDKRLGLEAMREIAYFEKQSEGTATFIRVLGSGISFFFALGAVLGAMITMYAAVAHRQREIGTLRALGFPRGSILLSFLVESALVAVAGGALGSLGALGLGAVRFSMMNFDTWSEVVFSFTPTPQTLATALGVSIAMGLAGGFLPALQAARLRPVQAMRE
ncbi:MAG: ABC transporter permease [Planctomycetales bacterium]|nr:ABC transporter permease [Planctomycetales bacterium]